MACVVVGAVVACARDMPDAASAAPKALPPFLESPLNEEVEAFFQSLFLLLPEDEIIDAVSEAPSSDVGATERNWVLLLDLVPPPSEASTVPARDGGENAFNVPSMAFLRSMFDVFLATDWAVGTALPAPEADDVSPGLRALSAPLGLVGGSAMGGASVNERCVLLGVGVFSSAAGRRGGGAMMSGMGLIADDAARPLLPVLRFCSSSDERASSGDMVTSTPSRMEGGPLDDFLLTGVAGAWMESWSMFSVVRTSFGIGGITSLGGLEGENGGEPTLLPFALAAPTEEALAIRACRLLESALLPLMVKRLRNVLGAMNWLGWMMRGKALQRGKLASSEKVFRGLERMALLVRSPGQNCG